MPPHIHNGDIRGQHKQAYPVVQRFCACNECSEYWSIDRGSNLPVRGQYLGTEQWKRHRSRALKAGIASERLARTPDTPLIPPPLFTSPAPQPRAPPIPRPAPKVVPQTIPQPTPPTAGPKLARATPQPVPATPQSATLKPTPAPADPTPTPSSPKTSQPPSDHKIPRKIASGSIKFDFYKTKLKDIQRALKNSQVEDIVKLIKKDQLVFVHVPTQHSSAPPSYALDGNIARNSTTIGHEEWLVQTRKFISTNLQKEHRDTHSRLLAKTLITQVEKDLAYLRKEIVKEWERQRDSLATVQLDTCAYVPGIARPMS